MTFYTPLDTNQPSEQDGLTHSQQSTIRNAINILQSRLQHTETMTSSKEVKAYCQLKLGSEKDEHFGCLFLSAQHRLIAFETLFKGTIDSASVYPRVVVRRALELNAAAIVFTHNHPSGEITPSSSDIDITRRLVDALKLIDVRVLDHVIVGQSGSTSMAESGLL